MTKTEIRDQLRELNYNLTIIVEDEELSKVASDKLEDAYALINSAICTLNNQIREGE